METKDLSEKIVDAIVNFSKLISEQQKQIWELQEKCANLEVIQMNLIASIAMSNPELSATIRENAEAVLKMLAEQNLGDSNLSKSLRMIGGIQEAKKPYLWVVPSQVSSEPKGQSTE